MVRQMVCSDAIRIIIYRTLVVLLLIAASLLAFSFLPAQESHAAAKDPGVKVTDYSTQMPGGTVYAQQVDEEMYLFLPREADTNHITLAPPESDPNANVFFSVNGTETAVLDLDKLTSSEGKYRIDVRVRSAQGDLQTSFALNIMKGNAVGTIYYTSDQKQSEGRDWIEADKSHKASGRAVVFDASGKNLTPDEKNQIITDIHGRGNSTWYNPKKSYQMKFDKKISLVDGAGKEKKWVLLAQYKDPLRMKDKIAKDIAALASENYSPRETWYNLYFDGEYRGLYLVSEKNEIKENRIDIHDMEEDYEAQDPDYGDNVITKEATNRYGNQYVYQEGLTGPIQMGGFLLEINEFDEPNGFDFISGSAGKKLFRKRTVNIKSPELASNEAVRYISEYFQAFADAAAARDAEGRHTGRNPATGLYYYDYCDLNSLADIYLANTVISSCDTFWNSQFFYKDHGEKMIAGPIWDIDLSFGVGNLSEIDPNKDWLASTLIAGDLSQIPSFRREVKERYQQIYAPILDSVISTGKQLPSMQQTFDLIRQDLAMDHVLWTAKWKDGTGLIEWDDSTAPEEILQHRINWLKQHKAFLDAYFADMDIPDRDAHIYGDPAPRTGKTHQRSCLNHPGEVISEKCVFDSALTGVSTVIRRATLTKAGVCRKQCICGNVRKQAIPKLKAAAVTINKKNVTAESVKELTAKVEAAGGDASVIILGSKVGTIEAEAFQASPVKTLIVKTKKLTKKSVRASLRGSKVTTVKVSIGSRETSSRYAKTYKKIFTAKNAGRKVRVEWK